MIRVIIVEDEKPILELMARLVRRHPMLEAVGAFTSPLEAIARFEELRPDAAFLDVEMPKMGGIELAGKLKEIDEDLQIVFTTAYPGYAVDAFRVNAVDYLLKPVTPDELERVVTRIVKNRELHAARKPSVEASEPTVHCLGTFETRGRDGALMSWPTRKTEELFAYFLAYPGRLTGKWQLADLLWPDMEESRSLHNLHNTIYRLKKALKEAGIAVELAHTNEGYYFEAPPYISDWSRLRQFVSSTARIDEGNAAEADKLLRSYRGELFGGKHYEWSMGAVSEAASQYVVLARMLTAWHREKADLSSAKETLRHYLGYVPLDEEMNAELLRLYAETGEAGPYLRHYDNYERMLAEELGIRPQEELRELAEKMR